MEARSFFISYLVWTPIYLWLFTNGTSFIGLNPFTLEFQNGLGEAAFYVLYLGAMVAIWVYTSGKIISFIEKYSDEESE